VRSVKPFEATEWTLRQLYDGRTYVVEFGNYSLNVLTGEDPCKHGNLPSEEFVVSEDLGKALVKLLNEYGWEES
jgi:hypothetical protein